jgi:putative hydrolase of the HAD superfamily
LNLSFIRAVLFDLDETLIDAASGLYAAQNSVAKELKKILTKNRIEISLEKIQVTIRAIDDSMNMQLNYDRNNWWQIALDQLAISLDLDSSFKKKLTKIYWNSYVNSVNPYEDTIPVLKYLKDKGYFLGLITDTDGAPGIKKSRIDKLTFCNIFDSIVIAGEDTEYTKPDPESYFKIAKSLDCSLDECIFVGDKPYTDIKGALNAGMKNILIQRRKWDLDTSIKPDMVIKDLKELRTFL